MIRIFLLCLFLTACGGGEPEIHIEQEDGTYTDAHPYNFKKDFHGPPEQDADRNVAH